MRVAVLLAAFVLALGGFVPAGAQPAIETRPVTFLVGNPLDPLAHLEVRGALFMPAAAACSSVMLLVHGLSYGQWAWDFPIEPQTYSTARALAGSGYPAVAIDLPGYGSSTKPDGYSLTVEGYAAMVAEMSGQLRDGSYGGPSFEHVGLMGHSAGTDISEIASGLFQEAAVLVATAYTHFPSQRIAQDFITGDMVRAAQDDYEYFGGTPEVREEYMYNRDFSEAAVRRLDNHLANLTPSGEIYSISPQPSRFFQPLVTAPVLLVLAENDLLFPVANGPDELALFASAADKTLYVAPTAGHSFMLHPNAPETRAAVLAWLGDPVRSAAFPMCSA